MEINSENNVTQFEMWQRILLIIKYASVMGNYFCSPCDVDKSEAEKALFVPYGISSKFESHVDDKDKDVLYRKTVACLKILTFQQINLLRFNMTTPDLILANNGYFQSGLKKPGVAYTTYMLLNARVQDNLRNYLEKDNYPKVMSCYTDEMVKHASLTIKLLTQGKSMIFLDSWNDLSVLPPVKAIHQMSREGEEKLMGLKCFVFPGGSDMCAEYFLHPHKSKDKLTPKGNFLLIV